MANITDSAGIFTGITLERFIEMQRLVLRDGDVAGAQQELMEAMHRIMSMVVVKSGTGSSYSRRRG